MKDINFQLDDEWLVRVSAIAAGSAFIFFSIRVVFEVFLFNDNFSLFYSRAWMLDTQLILLSMAAIFLFLYAVKKRFLTISIITGTPFLIALLILWLVFSGDHQKGQGAIFLAVFGFPIAYTVAFLVAVFKRQKFLWIPPLLILMSFFVYLFSPVLKTYIARTNRLSGQNVVDKTDNILSKGAAIASLPKANDETILTKTVIISKLEDADKQLMPVLCPKGKSCDFSLLNTEPADENLAWFAPAYDLALSVPFNNRWGTIGFGIAPVWESSLRGSWVNWKENTAAYSFGPLENERAGQGIWRRYYLYIQAAETAEEVLKELKDEDVTFSPKLIQLSNGLSAVQYERYGSGYGPTIEVLGPRFNYILNHHAFQKGEFAVIEGVANSIRLTTQ
ncbi:MAG: hypothetical protein AAB408_02490 [Patescibacteria group bacterium]